MIVCTLALYFQEFAEYPLIVAANRDEYFSRPSAAPRLLSEKPRILGGQDLLAGGTWLGVNEHGLLVGVLNRRSEEKKEKPHARSRGLLCLDLLHCRELHEAYRLLAKQEPSNYQPFNLLLASEGEAHVAYNEGTEMRCVQLDRGLHVLSNSAVFDPRSEKMDRAYVLFSNLRPRIQQASPESPSWIPAFKEALGDHVNSQRPKDAICVHAELYGTVSSSIILYARPENRFVTYYSPGAPCRSEFNEPIGLEVE